MLAISIVPSYGYWGWGWKGSHWEGWRTGLYPIVSLSLKYRQELGLDEEQVAKLEQIRSNFEEEARALFDQMRAIRDEIRTNIDNDDFISAQQNIERIADIRKSLLKKRLEAFRDAKNILTPEQVEKLKGMMKSRWCP